MSLPLHIAFVWHHHQPCFRTPKTGRQRLPGARLHGTKDYLDLILHLEKYPHLHQTVNIVPALILQLEEYALGRGFDLPLELLLSPIGNLTVLQKTYILEHCFDAYPATMILPYARYAQLWYQRQHWGVVGCLKEWQDQDYSDLLAWHNLAWFDPIFQDQDIQIKQWFQKGQNFTLSDRQLIYTRQRAIIRRILPKHRQMQDRGQLELMGSAYTDPILPLLWDTQAAKVANPDMLLPGGRFRWEGDILRQLARGKQIYLQQFHQEPQGFWPAELCVSPGILPAIAKQGFRWTLSDESVLGWSLGHYFSRDPAGTLYSPQVLYQPYRLETNYGDLSIVFRDQRLSDLIACSYSALSAEEATADFLGHLQRIFQLQREGGDRYPWLVTIALHGDRGWEPYLHDGKDFLETLYAKLAQSPWLKLVTVSEFLQTYPPREKIPPHQLHSGSWFDANFSPWIGDLIKNRAWEMLTEARQALSQHPEATPENNPEAWENLFAAEGADWFFCFGSSKNTGLNGDFELFFREHLQVVYRSLNESIPVSLLYPLSPEEEPTQPNPAQKYICPPIDGMGNDRLWQDARQLDINAIRGNLLRSNSIRKLWYGYNHFNFFLRLDFSSTVLEELPNVHLCWFYPGRMHFISPIPLHHVPDVSPSNYLFHHHLSICSQGKYCSLWQAQPLHQWYPVTTTVKIQMYHSLEVSLPWQDLIPEPGLSARLVIMLSQDGFFQMSLPEQKIISLEVP